jgi:hypothetical protein
MFGFKKRKPKEATPVPEIKVEETPVKKYTEDGCQINQFGYRMLMAYPKDIDYNNIPVSIDAYYAVYKSLGEKNMFGCMTGTFDDIQCGDFRFHILAVQRLVNYAASATVKLNYLKKQCIERGIASYDSSGNFNLNPVDKVNELV